MRYALLFGPPNSGKTTLFNALTGTFNKVINYPGSTVDIAIGKLINHEGITIIDAPGTQAFMPSSDDEAIAIQSLTELNAIIQDAPTSPDLIIYVLDATQSERHLSMIKRLIEDGYAVIVAITMVEAAKKQQKITSIIFILLKPSNLKMLLYYLGSYSY